MIKKPLILSSLFFLASCGNSDFVVESAKVVEIGKEQILEVQNAYDYLDSKPQTLTSKEHRPAYGTDGDYFSKPSAEDIYEKVYAMMSEVNPKQYPSLY